jgi:phosphoglycerol transferase MdoB-like AlkP superfamily enzyme
MRLSSVIYGGFIISPAAWIASTQLGQILPYSDCRVDLTFTTFTAAIAALVSIGGVALSTRRMQQNPSRMRTFVGRIAVLFGAAISFALLLQLVSSMVISPCAH